MEGLSANKRLFPISFGITLLWIGYFALWIASLIALDMTKQIGDEDRGGRMVKCGVVNKYDGQYRWLWIVVCYWSSYFFNNANLIVITAQLGEWFFKGDNADKNIWSRATVWAFHPFKSGGANAICAAIMGATQALMAYVNSKCKMVAAMFNPIEWIPLCLAFALKTIIHTYTKFGLVAASYSGKPFCEAASCTFQLLKQKLGEAIICDYIGKRVMSWCTYMLSLGVAMAALVWGNSLQNYDEANKIFSEIGFLIPTMLFLAYVVSFPFASIILIVLLEAMLPNDMDGTARAILNSLFAAIFMGSITNFLLRTMSHIVVSAMDVIYFCFAVEDDLGQKQERFEDLYTAIKLTIVPGTVNNQGVVMGVPPGQANTMQVACPEGCAAGTTVQVAIDGKGCGRLGTVIAGIVMLFVSCGGIVACSCPYWKLSSAFVVDGMTVKAADSDFMTVKASLWDVSISTKTPGVCADSELGFVECGKTRFNPSTMQLFDECEVVRCKDECCFNARIRMCGDKMQKNGLHDDECGKIHAVRFFVITALLLSLASANCFLGLSLPYLRAKCTAATLEKMTIAGKGLASVVLLWSLLGTCIAASVNMQAGSSLSGAGFLSLFLQILCCAFVLGLRRKATSSGATEEVHIGTTQAAKDAPPTLLSSGRRTEHKDLEKGDAWINVDVPAAVVVVAAEKTSSRY